MLLQSSLPKVNLNAVIDENEYTEKEFGKDHGLTNDMIIFFASYLVLQFSKEQQGWC